MVFVHTEYYSLALPRPRGHPAQAGLSSEKSHEKDRESARVFHGLCLHEDRNEHD